MKLSDIQKSACAGLNPNLEISPRKSKYGSRKVEVDGIVFDSKKEAKRYGELKVLLKAGEIDILALQSPFELNPGGTFSYVYKADFFYLDIKTQSFICEDVKGFRTVEYKKKAKLMLTVYGIKIREL